MSPHIPIMEIDGFAAQSHSSSIIARVILRFGLIDQYYSLLGDLGLGLGPRGH